MTLLKGFLLSLYPTNYNLFCIRFQLRKVYRVFVVWHLQMNSISIQVISSETYTENPLSRVSVCVVLTYFCHLIHRVLYKIYCSYNTQQQHQTTQKLLVALMAYQRPDNVVIIISNYFIIIYYL